MRGKEPARGGVIAEIGFYTGIDEVKEFQDPNMIGLVQFAVDIARVTLPFGVDIRHHPGPRLGEIAAIIGLDHLKRFLDALIDLFGNVELIGR